MKTVKLFISIDEIIWKSNIPQVLPKAAVNFGSGSVTMGTVAATPRNGAGFRCSTLLALILMSPRLPLVAKGIIPCDRPTPVSKTQLNQPVSHSLYSEMYTFFAGKYNGTSLLRKR